MAAQAVGLWCSHGQHMALPSSPLQLLAGEGAGAVTARGVYPSRDGLCARCFVPTWVQGQAAPALSCPWEGGWHVPGQVSVPGDQVWGKIGVELGVGQEETGASGGSAAQPHCWDVSKAPGSTAPKSPLPGPPEMSPFIHNCFLIAFCQLQRDGSRSSGRQ